MCAYARYMRPMRIAVCTYPAEPHPRAGPFSRNGKPGKEKRGAEIELFCIITHIYIYINQAFNSHFHFHIHISRPKKPTHTFKTTMLAHHPLLPLLLLLTTSTTAHNNNNPNPLLLLPQTQPPPTPLDNCDCTGTNDTGNSGVSYICHDPRLGPAHVPRTFPLLSFVSDYDRFGGETPGAFLKRWTDAEGRYVYPPRNGFQLDGGGEPILGNMTLAAGTKVDRFGSEYGMSFKP